MTNFRVTSVELHIAEDSLLEEGRVTLFFRLVVSPDFEPQEMVDTNLKDIRWFARITAQEEKQRTDLVTRIGSLRCRSSLTSKSGWLTLELARSRFDALYTALVRGHEVTEFTVTGTALEGSSSWAALSMGDHDIESIEIVMSIFSTFRGKSDT